MELIYMYIKNFGHKVDNKQFIEDKEFNFSDRFKIKFDLKSRKLNIEKIKDGHPNFYGKYIENVKMLVGENGTGKSTLLDVLGMNRNDRIDELYNQYPELFSSRDEVLNMVVSNYINADDLGKRPLAKLTRDICNELGLQ